MWRKLKRILVVLLLLILAFWVYVAIVNRDSKNMTIRQKVLRAVYPVWMWWANLTGTKSTHADNTRKKQPPVSFYSLKATDNNGREIDFATLKGKKILLVNTASDCGYTNQYEDLEALHKKYAGNLIVLGFPANDFKEQEKGTDEEIEEFCKLNYGITFPLMKKSIVIKGPHQNPVFQWLTDSARNGWNNRQPEWNFTKFLVSEEGVLTNYFGPTVSPSSKEITAAIQ
jgi:glutathione peroxidase